MVALAVYRAPVMAPVAGPRDLGVPASWIGYYIALVYLGSMFGSVAAGGVVTRSGALCRGPPGPLPWPLGGCPRGFDAFALRGGARGVLRRARLRADHAGELADPGARDAAFADRGD